jgi:hypothetical protein
MHSRSRREDDDVKDLPRIRDPHPGGSQIAHPGGTDRAHDQGHADGSRRGARAGNQGPQELAQAASRSDTLKPFLCM